MWPKLPELQCKHCKVLNPFIYFAPVLGQCICFECVKVRGWLDSNGDLKKEIQL